MGGGCPQQTSSVQAPASGPEAPLLVLGPGDQGVQPDRDAGQAGLGEGQVAPGVQHGQAGPVGGLAVAHHVADEQPDTERRGHHVMDIATAALGGGPVARLDVQPTDVCRGWKGHGGISGRERDRL
jgi:hypothetical protein